MKVCYDENYKRLSGPGAWVTKFESTGREVVSWHQVCVGYIGTKGDWGEPENTLSMTHFFDSVLYDLSEEEELELIDFVRSKMDERKKELLTIKLAGI